MKRTPAKTAPELLDKIMTLQELADYLQCHPTTIYRMLRERKLPAFKIGSDWRFFKVEIDRWVRASAVGPAR
jgi:excisionase family DNA binding protein